MSDTGLTINKLAKSADVNGYRQYSVETVARIRFIKRAQRLGFALKEISELLKLDDGQCQEAKQLAKQKLVIIEEDMADLSAMKASLINLIDSNKYNQRPDKVGNSALINALTN